MIMIRYISIYGFSLRFFFCVVVLVSRVVVGSLLFVVVVTSTDYGYRYRLIPINALEVFRMSLFE